MSHERTFPIIRAAVADSLAVDADEIELSSRLVDLGADSLDFIDLLFVLEKQFGVKLREDELDFLGKLDLTDAQVVNEGFLTPTVVEQLAAWLPALKDEPDPARIAPRRIVALISVQTLCLLVEKKLPPA